MDSGLHRAPHNGLVPLHQANLAGDASRHCPFHVACVTLSVKSLIRSGVLPLAQSPPRKARMVSYTVKRNGPPVRPRQAAAGP